MRTASNDVLEYIMAGAFAVEIGTANYRDPGVGNNIVSEIGNDLFVDKFNQHSSNWLKENNL